VSNANTRFG